MALLSGRASEQDRASAILQLRRAIDLRDKALKSAYSLDKIPGLGKSTYPKILSDLCVVMPLMRRKLIDIRNEVAHERVEPSVDLGRCLEYCEFTWYFLKSTDHLLSSLICALDFDSRTDPCEFTLSFDLADWSVELVGRFNLGDILRANRGHDIRIEATGIFVEGDFAYPRGQRSPRNTPNSERSVSCVFDQETMLKLLHIYFSVRY